MIRQILQVAKEYSVMRREDETLEISSTDLGGYGLELI